MKKLCAILLAAVTMASMTTVAFAKTCYELKDGFVTINTDSMDGGSDFIPGNSYTLPLMDGNAAFDDSSAEVWKISAKISNDTKKYISSFSMTKKDDGNYYLNITPKKIADNYGQTNTFRVIIEVQEKGILSKDAKVTSQTAADSYNAGTIENGQTVVLNDTVYTKFITTTEFTIGYPDVVYITDGDYEVDNDNPIAMASDIDRSKLKFGYVAEYDARFGATDKRFNLSYSTAANATVVANNPKANMVFVAFTGRPTFAANSDMRIMDSSMNYLYEIKDGQLTELPVKKDGKYIAYRTQTLGSFVASDVKLTGAAPLPNSSSSAVSSKPNSSSTGSYVPPLNSKPNPDTGR